MARRTNIGGPHQHPQANYRGSPFKPAASKQNFKEIWFSGVHGDIGGGYPETESGQIKIPLDWMIRETGAIQLIDKPTSVDDVVRGLPAKSGYVRLDPAARLHDSMTAMWKPFEYLPRRIPKTPSESMATGAECTFHFATIA